MSADKQLEALKLRLSEQEKKLASAELMLQRTHNQRAEIEAKIEGFNDNLGELSKAKIATLKGFLEAKGHQKASQLLLTQILNQVKDLDTLVSCQKELIRQMKSQIEVKEKEMGSNVIPFRKKHG